MVFSDGQVRTLAQAQYSAFLPAEVFAPGGKTFYALRQGWLDEYELPDGRLLRSLARENLILKE